MMAGKRAILFIFMMIAAITNSAPSRAGFWDEMFGGPRAWAPAVQYDRPYRSATPRWAETIRHRHKPTRVAVRHRHDGHHANAPADSAREPGPVPQHFASASAEQAALAAKADETLEPGDVVSSTEGLLVYVGNKGVRHFVSADDRLVGARLRKLLHAYAKVPPTKRQNAAVSQTNPAALDAAQARQRYVANSDLRRVRNVGGSVPESASEWPARVVATEPRP